MKSLLFTAILSLRKRSEQLLIKFAILLQVRLTHAQTFFRGVPCTTPAPPRCTTLRTPNNKSAAIAYVTMFDQSECGYKRTSRCLTNQSAAIAYVTLFDQSERGYSVRHAVYVTPVRRTTLHHPAPPRTTLRSLKNPARSALIILLRVIYQNFTK